MSSLNRPYHLNQDGVPVENFDWTQALETWSQRSKIQVTWRFTETRGVWSAVACFTINGRPSSFSGEDRSKSKAKAKAVIRIEDANVLRL